MLRKPTLDSTYHNTIKKINELPSWYSLTKYGRTKKLTSADWHEQLFVRLFCFYYFQIEEIDKQNPTIYKEHESLRKTFYECLEKIRREPIVNILTCNTLYSLFGSGVAKTRHNTLKNKPLKHLSVHPTEVRELYMFENIISKTKGIEARVHFFEAYASQGFYTPKHKHHEWFNDTVAKLLRGRTIETLVTINLKQPDVVILEQLETILPAIRKKSGIKQENKKYNRLKTEDLVKNGVLPFLDLHIWQLENKIKIPNRLMAQAIYTNYDCGSNTLKTTRALALKCLDASRLDYFAEQSIIEEYIV